MKESMFLDFSGVQSGPVFFKKVEEIGFGGHAGCTRLEGRNPIKETPKIPKTTENS